MWDINNQLCAGKGLLSPEKLPEGPSYFVVWSQPHEVGLLGSLDGLKLQGLYILLPARRCTQEILIQAR